MRITPPDVRERYRDRADVALGAIPHAAVTRAVNEALFTRRGDARNYDMDAGREVARKDTPVIVAVPSKTRGAPIVGEAYYDPDAYGGTWWWGTTSEKDWGASCIEDGNDGPPFAWQPMPAAPQQEAFQPQQDEVRTEAAQ
ncbi:hypothetical protein [Azospirillum sp. TSO22-1]|uniref:hypothetical protein n=1 Tax=Azospirillum sp. TSO22-1 TaxID=716789 RepID=UPI000D6089CB|nr:hypothetical protein [Azospirillum sp. TSO22-1]PWC54631.1 hypothetical protein TSO221_08330 [Azospirillum sp. TSO22-1]